MTSRNLLLAIPLAILATAAGATGPGVPPQLTYEGRLLDANGSPDNALRTFVFNIWSSANDGGSLLYTETDPGVAVTDGLCSVTLGTGSNNLPTTIFNGSTLYLELEIDGHTLSPRQAITSVPYAFAAGQAVNVVGGTVNATQISVNNSAVIDSSGNWVGSNSGLIGPTGPSGPTGPTGLTGAPGQMGVPGASLNPLQIAIKRWYPANQVGSNFPAGNDPQEVESDGTNIWVASSGARLVTEIVASTGATAWANSSLTGTPTGMAYDGVGMWVALTGGSLTRILTNGTDGGTYSLTAGTQPQGVAFDGANIWVTNNSSTGNVIKVPVNDPTATQSFAVGAFPYGIAFDGTYIWVTNNIGTGTVTRLLASDGGSEQSFLVGGLPRGVAFDGSNIWVANSQSNNITELSAATGTVLATPTVGTAPQDLAFDGTSVWVTNSGSNSVSKVLVSSGAVSGPFPAGSTPWGIAFDGANMWVANSLLSGTVTKL